MSEGGSRSGNASSLARWRAGGSAWLAERRRRDWEEAPAQWSLGELSGRIAELSGLGDTALLSLAFALVRDAQRQGEPAAWITSRESTFFPPDAAFRGIDLEALAVVFVADAPAAARAAERLVRSGAFGLVTLDLASLPEPARGPIPAALQSRLAGLALRHGTAVLCLTEKAPDAASLGPLISLRCAAVREALPPAESGAPWGRFRCRVQVLKDKRRGPGWEHAEVFRGPDGLR